MKKLLLYTLIPLLLIACKNETLDVPIEQSIAEPTIPYGPNITQLYNAFLGDNTIACKSSIRTVVIDGVGYGVIAGIKNNHLWFQAIDIEKDVLLQEGLSSESVSQPYKLYLGYGEEAPVTFTEVWPAFYQTTEKGALITWYAYDGDRMTSHPAHQMICWEFKYGSSSKLVDFISLQGVLREAILGYDCAFCEEKCYSLEGEFQYELSSGQIYWLRAEDIPKYFVSREEAIEYGLNNHLGLSFELKNLKENKTVWYAETDQEKDEYTITYKSEWNVKKIDDSSVEFKGKFVLYDGTIYYRTAKLNIAAGQVLYYSTEPF